MTEHELARKCQVTTIEWLIHWRREKRTGRKEYPEPVHIDESITLSTEVRELRDVYLMMRAQNPKIGPATFRWEQIDGWNMDIQLRSRPDILIGGVRAQYRPKVFRCVGYIEYPPISSKGWLAILCLLRPLIVPFLFPFLFHLHTLNSSDVQGKNSLLIGIGLLMTLFGYLWD